MSDVFYCGFLFSPFFGSPYAFTFVHRQQNNQFCLYGGALSGGVWQSLTQLRLDGVSAEEPGHISLAWPGKRLTLGLPFLHPLDQPGPAGSPAHTPRTGCFRNHPERLAVAFLEDSRGTSQGHLINARYL